MKIKRFLLGTAVAAALSIGLCGCGSNKGNSGANLYRGVNGSGTGNTGFYGDYTYGANKADRKKAGTDRKNMTDTMDNANSRRSTGNNRQTTGLGNSGEAYFYDADGNIMRSDATGGIVGSDNYRTSTSEGFAFPEAPVVP